MTRWFSPALGGVSAAVRDVVADVERRADDLERRNGRRDHRPHALADWPPRLPVPHGHEVEIDVAARYLANEQITGADGWASVNFTALSEFPVSQKQQLRHACRHQAAENTVSGRNSPSGERRSCFTRERPLVRSQVRLSDHPDADQQRRIPVDAIQIREGDEAETAARAISLSVSPARTR